MITTSFDGLVKKFQVAGHKGEVFLKNIRVTFLGSSIDTDNDSRNEKMYEQSLDTKNHNEIVITIKAAVKIMDKKGNYQRVPATIKLRGKSKDFTLRAKVIKKDGVIWVEGDATMSLKEMGIPDPSIAIASVRDRFDLSFKVKI